MKTTQKGAISGRTLAIFIVVIIAIILIGWMWKRGDRLSTKAETATSTTTQSYSYIIGDSTSTSTATVSTKPKTTTQAAYVTKETPAYNSYTGVVGTTSYHNGTYGLTLRLPSAWTGYRTYMTAGGPSGLSGTAKLHFVAPGETSDAFVINVWNKEQWNKIRTEENFAHRNTVDSGEGMYLGENFTWIYSTNTYSHQSEVQSVFQTAVFY